MKTRLQSFINQLEELIQKAHQSGNKNDFIDPAYTTWKQTKHWSDPKHKIKAMKKIIINNQEAVITPISALMNIIPVESDYRKYYKNHDGWLESNAVYFSGDTVLEYLDLDNPFGLLVADWQERWDKANDTTDKAAQDRLWEEWKQQMVRLIVVEGNLTIQRYLLNDETDGSGGLVVLGDLGCPNVIVGGQEIFVQNNLSVTGLFWGDYNHGSLKVMNNADIYVLLETDYDIAVHGMLNAQYHWDDSSFTDALYDIQLVLHKSCFDDPDGEYASEILSRYTMQQRLIKGEPLLLEAEGRSANRIFKDYNLSVENLNTLCALRIIIGKSFQYNVEDVSITITKEHTDASGKTWYNSIRLTQDDNEVFACNFKKPQNAAKPGSLLKKLFSEPAETAFTDTLEVMWLAPDNNWYYPSEHTPLAHRHLLTHFLPMALARAAQMESLSREDIEACQQQIRQAITPQKLSWYLSRPIVTQEYNDYYDDDKNGYWNGQVYFAFRQNDDTYCDRLQLVEHRHQDELKYYPSVIEETDSRGYYYDLIKDDEGNDIVSIDYMPHREGRGSYPLTSLDVGHYQKALRLWNYFEAHFIKDNLLFEAGEWDEYSCNDTDLDLVAELEKGKDLIISTLGIKAYQDMLNHLQK